MCFASISFDNCITLFCKLDSLPCKVIVLLRPSFALPKKLGEFFFFNFTSCVRCITDI